MGNSNVREIHFTNWNELKTQRKNRAKDNQQKCILNKQQLDLALRGRKQNLLVRMQQCQDQFFSCKSKYIHLVSIQKSISLRQSKQNIRPASEGFYSSILQILLILLALQQMSIVLTPKKSVKQFRCFSSTIYSNPNLQPSVFKVQNYREINEQLIKSQQENHLLQATARTYSVKRIHRIYGRSNSAKKSQKNQVVHNKRQVVDPEDLQIVQALSRKVGFTQENHEAKRMQYQLFEEEVHERITLQEKTFELKRKIFEERKLKEKTLLKNSKLINERNNSLKNTQILKDQSRQNLFLICLMASECSSLDLQLDNAQKMSRESQRMKHEQQKRVAQLEDQIECFKNQIDLQENELVQIQLQERIKYRQITNSYSIIKQLKEEKVILLNKMQKDIDSNL